MRRIERAILDITVVKRKSLERNATEVDWKMNGKNGEK